MTLSIKAITDYKNLIPIKDSWDKIVRECSNNPFLLSTFTKAYIELNRLIGWNPLLLIVYSDNTPVGMAPLKIKSMFGVPTISFLHRPTLPDFVIYEKYRKKSIEKIIDYIFNTLNCQLADLTLRAESPNIKTLQQTCKKQKINLKQALEIGDEKGRLIVPIQTTWEEYTKKRGRLYRKTFRQTTRRLNKAGFWKITRRDNEEINEECIKKVQNIDESSWKKAWRTKKRVEKDHYLYLLLKYSKKTLAKPEFSASVYFLELNNKPISFSIVIFYKKIAYFIKTSYNKNYRRFQPGKYVINSAISELFNTQEIDCVDFITALPFSETWALEYKPRIKIIATKKTPTPISISIFLTSPHIRKIYKNIQHKIPIIDIW
jgi:hypothetical protein